MMEAVAVPTRGSADRYANYWSSEENDSGNHFAVNLSNGDDNAYPDNNDNRVVCVSP